jgi:hypothetical protein
MDKKNKFYDYNELIKLVIDNNITTKDEYICKYKSLSSTDKRAPINPRTFYGDKIWVNWSVFLGKKIHSKKNNGLYYKFNECKKIIHGLNIKSKTDFYKKIKDLINDDISIPYNPYKIYQDEWVSWGDFLGNGKIQDNKRVFLSFDEAKKWAKSLNLKIIKEWRNLDLEKLPLDIPKKPEKTYKNKGWVDYYDWLGIDKKQKISYGEKKIYDFLEEKNIEFKHNTPIFGCKNINNLVFDFYIPEKNICIEFDGIQHFQSVDFFGGDKEFEKTKKRDLIKNLFCDISSINLIRIPYFLTDIEITNKLKKEVI